MRVEVLFAGIAFVALPVAAHPKYRYDVRYYNYTSTPYGNSSSVLLGNYTALAYGNHSISGVHANHTATHALGSTSPLPIKTTGSSISTASPIASIAVLPTAITDDVEPACSVSVVTTTVYRPAPTSTPTSTDTSCSTSNTDVYSWALNNGTSSWLGGKAPPSDVYTETVSLVTTITETPIPATATQVLTSIVLITEYSTISEETTDSDSTRTVTQTSSRTLIVTRTSSRSVTKVPSPTSSVAATTSSDEETVTVSEGHTITIHVTLPPNATQSASSASNNTLHTNLSPPVILTFGTGGSFGFTLTVPMSTSATPVGTTSPGSSEFPTLTLSGYEGLTFSGYSTLPGTGVPVTPVPTSSTEIVPTSSAVSVNPIVSSNSTSSVPTASTTSMSTGSNEGHTTPSSSSYKTFTTPVSSNATTTSSTAVGPVNGSISVSSAPSDSSVPLPTNTTVTSSTAVGPATGSTSTSSTTSSSLITLTSSIPVSTCFPEGSTTTCVTLPPVIATCVVSIISGSTKVSCVGGSTTTLPTPDSTYSSNGTIISSTTAVLTNSTSSASSPDASIVPITTTSSASAYSFGYGAPFPSSNATRTSSTEIGPISGSSSSSSTEVATTSFLSLLPPPTDLPSSSSTSAASYGYGVPPLPSNVTTPSSTNSLSSGVTVAPSPSKTPISCGESGNFTLNWDDEPIFTPDNTTIGLPPVFNPYHHLFFANGYAYTKPFEQPPISSSPNLAVFLPNITETNVGSPSAAGLLPGEIGAGPRAADNTWWFDAFSAELGCGSGSGERCNMVITGYSFDAQTQEEVQIVQQTATIPGCETFFGCDLQHVELNSSFRGLSGIQFEAFAGTPFSRLFVMDNLNLGWSNNTCEAGLLRLRQRK